MNNLNNNTQRTHHLFVDASRQQILADPDNTLLFFAAITAMTVFLNGIFSHSPQQSS
jgi:hypothetical protein